MRVHQAVIASITLGAGKAMAADPTALSDAAADRKASVDACLKSFRETFALNGASATADEMLGLLKELGPTCKDDAGIARRKLAALVYGTDNPVKQCVAVDHGDTQAFMSDANLEKLVGNTSKTLNIKSALNHAGLDGLSDKDGDKHAAMTTGQDASHDDSNPSLPTKQGMLYDVDNSKSFDYESGTKSYAFPCDDTKAAVIANSKYNACLNLFEEEKLRTGTANADGMKEVLKAIGYVDVVEYLSEFRKKALGNVDTDLETGSLCRTADDATKYAPNSTCEANLLKVLVWNGATKDGSAKLAETDKLAKLTQTEWLTLMPNPASAADLASYKSVPAMASATDVTATGHKFGHYGNTHFAVGLPRVTTKAIAATDTKITGLTCSWSETKTGSGKYMCTVTASTHPDLIGTGTDYPTIVGMTGSLDGFDASSGNEETALAALKAALATGTELVISPLSAANSATAAGVKYADYVHTDIKTLAAKSCPANIRAALKAIKDDHCMFGSHLINWSAAGSHLRAFEAAFVGGKGPLKDAVGSQKDIQKGTVGILPALLAACGMDDVTAANCEAKKACTEDVCKTSTDGKTSMQAGKKDDGTADPDKNKCVAPASSSAGSRFAAGALVLLAAFAF